MNDRLSRSWEICYRVVAVKEVEVWGQTHYESLIQYIFFRIFIGQMKFLWYHDHIERTIILRRTCHFVNDTQRKRILYLTLVRSQFAHCSQIWHPGSESMIGKFEAIQKKCIKWILSEEELTYRPYSVRKCRQVNILLLRQRFKLNDMILFHKILNRLILEELPSYLCLFSGHTHLRSSHLDRLSFVPSILPRGSTSFLLNKSFLP